MSELTPCPHCAELLFTGASTCPHCAQHVSEGSTARPLPLLMLGIALVGCGDKDDTGDTGEDTIQPEPEYGVAATADEPAEAEAASAAQQPAQVEGQSSSTTENRPKS